MWLALIVVRHPLIKDNLQVIFRKRNLFGAAYNKGWCCSPRMPLIPRHLYLS